MQMKQIKLICLIELIYLLNNVSSMKIMSGNQCVSKSPSKLEGVPEGRGRVPSSLAVTTHSSGALRHLP